MRRRRLRRVSVRNAFHFQAEQLESRQLLANLTAHWLAQDLTATHEDGQAVAVWNDSVGDVSALATGAPVLKHDVYDGHSAVRFDPSDGPDFFRVRAIDSPMSGANDFTIVVVFATQSDTLIGDSESWFDNSGLIDASQFGAVEDWGLSINQAGQVAAGIGNPRTTQFSTATGLNDGGSHVAIYTKGGNQISLYVDGQVGTTQGVSEAARDAREVWIGAVPVGLFGLHPYAGDIVEIRMYDDDLSPADVVELNTELLGKYRNSPPIAQDDTFQTDEDVPLVVPALGVLENDTDLDDTQLTAVRLEEPSHGVLELQADGSFVYTPFPNVFGPDSFRYRVADNQSLVETIFLEDFNSIRGTRREFNGAQFESGMPVLFSGSLSSWLESGSSTAHAVDVANVTSCTTECQNADDIVNERDWAIMIWEDNVITQARRFSIPGSNTAGITYLVDFTAGPAVYQNGDQQTRANDGLLIEVLRPDDTVLTSFTKLPGPWSGSMQLVPGQFHYVGDGLGDIRFRIGPSKTKNGRFGGAIDDLSLSFVLDSATIGTVNIDVLPQADAPQAAADRFVMSPDAETFVASEQGILVNDFHPDGLAFKADLIEDAQHGTLALAADGSLRYRPQPGFHGVDQFRYRLNDGTRTSEIVTVDLVVSANPVLVSEFVAHNEAGPFTRTRSTEGVRFEGGVELYDWIEITNRLAVPIDLNGLHLTDDLNDRTKWEFPSGSVIPAGGSLVVYASELDITDWALDESGRYHTNFKLDARGESLAMTWHDGRLLDALTEVPAQFTDVSYGVGLDGQVGYFMAPSPGDLNGTMSTRGPLVSAVTSNPGAVAVGQELVVTAHVESRGIPIESVELVYVVMFGDEQTLTMVDDGTTNDAVAGDHLYTATLPGGASAGQMLRWRIVAKDQQGNATAEPPFLDRSSTRQSPEYFGTIITDSNVESQLTTFHWYVQTPKGVNRGTRASVFLDGQFYDNVFVRIRGASSRGVRKNSYKFEFNVGHDFRYAADAPRVNEFNLNTTFQDKAYIRAQLAYEYYQDAGAVASDSGTWRVQQNGDFFSVASFAENIDADMLDHHGLDSNGALYKLTNGNGVTSIRAGVEKKTRLHEDRADLQELVDGVNGSNPDRGKYVFDNIDLPGMISYLTAGIISQDFDRWQKNIFLYRDTNGTGEWLTLGHDKDLTWGNRFYDDEISGNGFTSEKGIDANKHRAHPFQTAVDHNCCGPNRKNDALITHPRVREMYLRYLRTLMDQQLQPPGTPVEERRLEAQIDEMATALAPDAVLDLEAWGAIYGRVIDFSTAIQELKTDYLEQRRVYLYETHGLDGPAGFSVGIPGPQVGNPELAIGAVEFNPASGNQLEEYVRIDNPHAVAVDISNWRLTGAVDFTFRPGTVIPSHDSIYVSPDVRAFRTRTSGPTGGQELFVQGAYDGRLANSGGTLGIVAADGTVVAQHSYVGNRPNIGADLRISEIHYNPADPSELEIAAGHDNNNDFEFIELVNVGAEVIQLSDARFVQLIDGERREGIDFDFSESTIKELGPGERVLVVEDLDAFVMRYGRDLPVAGVWTGRLGNGGETITLLAGDRTIHQFAYDDAWYPTTDGDGDSLEVVDPSQPDLGQWATAAHWQPSTRHGGSPGAKNGKPIPGDSNRDGRFDSADIVYVLNLGEYEDGIPNNSTFEEGDWNDDGDFDSEDIVFAFIAGTYVSDDAAASRSSLAAAVDAAYADDDDQMKVAF